MNVCKNCHHWEAYSENVSEKFVGLGECYHPKMYEVILVKDGPRDVVFAGEVSCCPLGLTTGPDFGCIHFSQKKQ